MKNTVWIILAGIIAGIATGYSLSLGYDFIAAGFGIAAIIAIIALVYWRNSRTQVKLLKAAREIQKLPKKVDEISQQLKELQNAISNIEESEYASAKKIRNEIKVQATEYNLVASQLKEQLNTSTKLSQGDDNASASSIETRISQLNQLVDASTRRIRNDLKTQSNVTSSLLDRNHRARANESAQNARLLDAIEKQRDLLGTLVINSDFQFGQRQRQL